jgi:hypothetical protein
MISQFIRAQWESEELEGVDDERRQILEEAAELDHIWGVWEVEKEPTNGPGRWIRQPSLSVWILQSTWAEICSLMKRS